ncbi:hypothetical protein EUGRSUZ_J00740 [Eucalyptus grandis]|uniref:Transmembrane protein n=2 Tax=Eucalyptus grandis TaxID=71139 RepID=A0A059ABX0_EUCGR|nr:hypothetical protein EUGRSUZ_J00740 [Eucalyptus grandis]
MAHADRQSQHLVKSTIPFKFCFCTYSCYLKPYMREKGPQFFSSHFFLFLCLKSNKKRDDKNYNNIISKHLEVTGLLFLLVFAIACSVVPAHTETKPRERERESTSM